jgi:hypothetical protein
MDALPDEIIIAFEKFLPIPDSINLGKTSSRLHALTRYGRSKIIAARKDILRSIKQINYSIEQINVRMYDYISIRVRDDRISVSGNIPGIFNGNNFTRSILRIASNKLYMPKNIGNHVAINHSNEITIFHTPDTFLGYETSIINIIVNNKPEISKNKDIAIQHMIQNINVPTDYRIIDAVASAMFNQAS